MAETDATIVINGYSCTVTLGTNELSDEVITQGYYADNNGNMIMKNANKGAYIKPDDSVICLAGVSNIGGTDVTIYAPGTIEDGLEFTVLSGVAGTTYSIGDPVFNYTTVDSYIDLNLLTKVVFDFTRGATTQTVTYSYFIVPYEVTAERSVHPSANTIEMLEIIPIMVLIGIVLATIGLVMFKRNQ